MVLVLQDDRACLREVRFCNFLLWNHPYPYRENSIFINSKKSFYPPKKLLIKNKNIM